MARKKAMKVGFDVIIRVPSRVPSLPEFSCMFPIMAEKDSGFSISSTSGDEASKLEIDIQSARLLQVERRWHPIRAGDTLGPVAERQASKQTCADHRHSVNCEARVHNVSW
jgi:hypothetical protein